MPYKYMDLFFPDTGLEVEITSLAAWKELLTCKISLFLNVSVLACVFMRASLSPHEIP